jgi:hypothetical protein
MKISSLTGKPPAPVDPHVAAEQAMLLSAKSTARDKVRRVLNQHRLKPYLLWQQVEEAFGYPIPTELKAIPLSTLALNAWCEKYVNDTAKRVELARQAAAAQLTQGVVLKDDLLPFNLNSPPCRPVMRQRKAYSQIMRELYTPNAHARAALLPLNTGAGKTYIAAAVIKNLQQNNYYGAQSLGIMDVFYICPKRVQIKTRRVLAAAGIRGVDTEVQVVTFNELSSRKFNSHFAIETVDRFGSPTEVYKWRIPAFRPKLIIVDECHKIKKPKSKITKIIQAFLEFTDTRWLFMSATPAVVSNDLQTFALASRKIYGNEPVSFNNWSEVARAIGGADPARVHKKIDTLRHMRDWFGDLIVDPPQDPRKVKQFCNVKIVPFDNETQRLRYRAAEEDWRIKCERIGKIPSERGEALALTTMFRMRAEQILAPTLGKLALESHAKGFSPIIGVASTESVKLIIAFLTKNGVERNNISLIWGGTRIIKEHEVYTLYEFNKIADEVHNNGGTLDHLDAKKKAKYRLTQKYFTQRWGVGESAKEQAERNDWLERMMLKPQTAEAQQIEVDKFQAGATQFCIFTLAAGSVGIDLDHQHDQARPRESFFSPTFYAEEIIQAFGRGYRESTISNINQWMVFLKDTIVANTVAPMLSNKIRNVNQLARTGLDLETPLIEAVANGKVKPALDVIVEDTVGSGELMNDDDGDLDADNDEEDDDELTLA